MYGKLIDGALTTASKTLSIDNKVIYNPSNELYEKMGYLPIVETDPPVIDETDEPKTYEKSYVEENEQIIAVWNEVEPTEETETPTQPTIEDRVLNLENNLSATMEAVDYLIIESGDTDA